MPKRYTISITYSTCWRTTVAISQRERGQFLSQVNSKSLKVVQEHAFIRVRKTALPRG